MNKKYICLLLAVISICSSGCAGNETSTTEITSDDIFTSEISEDNDSSILSDDDLDNDFSADLEEEPISDETQEKLDVLEARDFHEGYAWVKTENSLCMVNKTGQVIKSFPGDYAIREDFSNGLSAVDPHASITHGGNFGLSDEAFLVNTQGDTVFTVSNEGYTPYNVGDSTDSTDYTFGGLADHSVILKKNIDDFEKSGDYYYHYDLDTKTATEIDSVWLKTGDYSKELTKVQYVGNGYYCKGYSEHFGTRQDESLNFYHFNSGKVLSFRKNSAVEQALGKNAEFKNWEVNSYDNGAKVWAFVETDDKEAFFKIDFNEETCELIPVKLRKEYSSYINECFYHSEVNLPKYVIASTDGGYSNTDMYLYDLHSNQSTNYYPKEDYQCSIKEYVNGRFLIITKNENDTEFFTVLENNKTLFSPKKYSQQTALMGDYVVFDSEEGVQIMDLKTGSVQSKISSTQLVYSDRTNNIIWMSDASNTYTECYDVTTGEKIFELNEGVTALSDFSDDMAAVCSVSDQSVYYVSKSGEKMKFMK